MVQLRYLFSLFRQRCWTRSFNEDQNGLDT